MYLIYLLAVIGFLSLVKWWFTRFPLLNDQQMKTAKQEAKALRAWMKKELARLHKQIEEIPELRKMDAGVVAANPALQAADDETLAAYGIYRRDDGFYFVNSPLDPRDAVLAMSDKEAEAAYWEVIKVSGIFPNSYAPEWDDDE